jgi:hypothetical protein
LSTGLPASLVSPTAAYRDLDLRQPTVIFICESQIEASLIYDARIGLPMNRIMKFWSFIFQNIATSFVVLIFAIALLCLGCAGKIVQANVPEDHVAQSFITPNEFIQQIKSTDCIIVSNRFSGEFPKDEHLSVKLSPEQVREVLAAIGSLKTYPMDPGSASAWDLQLQFFHHDKMLGYANFEGAAIVIDREYRDNTGTLKRIYEENYAKLLPSIFKQSKQ